MRKRPKPPSPGRLRSLRCSPGFRAFVLDQLEELGGVTSRAMFGGVGLYREGLFFGIIAADGLYLKADESTRADFEAAGAHPFRPYPDRAGTMQYYAVPVEVLESGIELAAWARKAVAVAARGQSGRRRTPPRR